MSNHLNPGLEKGDSMREQKDHQIEDLSKFHLVQEVNNEDFKITIAPS
jgi:hypothetical protein